MTPASQPFKHSRGCGIIGRLAKHFTVKHDLGVGTQHPNSIMALQCSQSGTGLVAGDAPHVFARCLIGCAPLRHLYRYWLKINTNLLQQLSAPG